MVTFLTSIISHRQNIRVNLSRNVSVPSSDLPIRPSGLPSVRTRSYSQAGFLPPLTVGARSRALPVSRPRCEPQREETTILGLTNLRPDVPLGSPC